MGIDAKMFSRYRGPKPTEEQLKLWSWDLCRAIGATKFMIDPDKGEPALGLAEGYEGDEQQGGKAYGQDGPDIIAEDGEWFVEASLWTRYYGKGYERGDWQSLIHIAEWMERRIGPVWYGGDSSGVLATLFDKAARDELVAHALSVNGRDYFNGFERGAFATPAPCYLCVKERGMTRHGWGAMFSRVACGGCGRSFESRDDGVTWVAVKET